MNLVGAFLKMIRLPNLFFIALTQILFHTAVLDRILLPLGTRPSIDGWNFILLVVSSVLIAAAGYIINDYFDINIDQINKPTANVVDKIVSRRWAMAWHFVLSGFGYLIKCLDCMANRFLVYSSRKFHMCSFIIRLFSFFKTKTTFRKHPYFFTHGMGNFSYWFGRIYFSCFYKCPLKIVEASGKIIRISLLYAGFAFISSLIREAIKDIEDLKGDEKYGCRTMPIVWGVNAAKVYIAVWLVVILALLIILQVYVARFEWWWAMAYSIVFIIVPFVLIFLLLFRAKENNDYHRLSNWTKLVMLTGILSMIFFYFYL